MLKADLEKENKLLKEKIENLEFELDNLNGFYAELEREVCDLHNKQNEQNSINDIDDFIFRLKCDNLYTDELEQFIEYYFRFYNK